MQIDILPYDPSSITKFKVESSLLRSVFNDVEIHIEHIGSTAVPGLSAKPVIDILVGLSDLSTAGRFIPLMIENGYNYISSYENGFPERKFFFKDVNSKRVFNIHMVEYGTAFWNRHIAFRDHLRNDDQCRLAYQDLKIKLAEHEWIDGNEYAAAKTKFIRAVENEIM